MQNYCNKRKDDGLNYFADVNIIRITNRKVLNSAALMEVTLDCYTSSVRSLSQCFHSLNRFSRPTNKTKRSPSTVASHSSRRRCSGVARIQLGGPTDLCAHTGHFYTTKTTFSGQNSVGYIKNDWWNFRLDQKTSNIIFYSVYIQLYPKLNWYG